MLLSDTVAFTETDLGDELARQTAQAKMLREARDELAARARALAEAKTRKGLECMGLTATSEDMAGPSLATKREPQTSRE
jgi:ribosome assembly protein YihI (activator of Der GTPase)